jgi:hypothetical protein
LCTRFRPADVEALLQRAPRGNIYEGLSLEEVNIILNFLEDLIMIIIIIILILIIIIISAQLI